jgi:hypothetical protein
VNFIFLLPCEFHHFVTMFPPTYSRLHLQGWATVNVPITATESYFPLPHDVGEKVTVVVAAAQAMPPCAGPEVVVLEYECVRSDGSSLQGQLPWRASVLLQPK